MSKVKAGIYRTRFKPPHPRDPQRSRKLEKDYARLIIKQIKRMKRHVRILVLSLKPLERQITKFQTPEERIALALEQELAGITDPFFREQLERRMRDMWQTGRRQAERQLQGMGIQPPPPTITREEQRKRRMLQNINVGLIRTIARQYLDRVRDAVARYMVGDFTYPQLIREIQNIGRTSTGAHYPEWKAHRIARTETTRALSISKGRTYLEAGVIYWQWITALDERVCPICRPLHGRVVKIGRVFGRIRRRRRPDIPINRPPAHPNCRCGIMPSPVDAPVSIEEINRMIRLGWRI